MRWQTLHAWDVRLLQKLRQSPTTRLYRLSSGITHLGDGKVVCGVLIGMALLGWVMQGTSWLTTALSTLWAVVLTAGLVGLLKWSIRRPRPTFSTEFVTFTVDRYSFPSGHAARCAACATIILISDLHLGLFLWSVALLVSGSRVILGLHYPSDVLGGLIGGVVIALVSHWMS